MQPTGKLVTIQGAQVGREFPLGATRVVLGRADNASIVVEDQAVSRQHIEITADQRGFVVRDLNSGNGTYLNGEQIREAELVDGDRIEIGAHLFAFSQTAGTPRNPYERQIVFTAKRNAPAGSAAAPMQAPAPAPMKAPAPAPMKVAPVGQQVRVPLGPVGAPPGGKTTQPKLKKRKKKKKKASPVMVTLVFLFSAAFLALAAVIATSLIERHETAEPTPADVSRTYIEAGNAALAAGDFSGAREQFTQALSGDPSNAEAEAGLSVAARESRMADLLAEADQLVHSGQPVQAIVNFDTVITQSQYHRSAANIRLDTLLAQLVSRGRDAVDQGDLETGETLVDVVLSADPAHGSALALREEMVIVRNQTAAANPNGATDRTQDQQSAQSNTVAALEPVETNSRNSEESSDEADTRRERRRERRERREREREQEDETTSSVPERDILVIDGANSETNQASDSESDNTQAETESSDSGLMVIERTEPEPTQEAEPERRQERSSSHTGRGMTRAWGHYESGDFDEAAEAMRDIADGSSDDADAAAEAVARLPDFGIAYTGGLEAFEAGEYEYAVHELRRAYSLDRRLQSHYREGIAEMLATSYYNLAQTAYDADEYRDAGQNANYALRYDSRHGETLRLINHLEDVARDLWIQANRFQTSNPERAMQLCRDIEQMLPDSNDLRQQAEELREQLGG